MKTPDHHPYRIVEANFPQKTLVLTVHDINDPMAIIDALSEMVSDEDSPTYGWHLESFFISGHGDGEDDLAITYQATFGEP